MQIFLNGADLQLERLEKMGDPLIKINEIIDWEAFRAPLEKSLRKADYKRGGRPAHDVILMFKIVMLMSWYNLSYNQAEYQINNRLDFMRFLKVEIGHKMPDENTIWDFKEAIKNHKLDEQLFKLFYESLGSYGIVIKSGTLVDASFVEVPKRRVISEQELKNPDELLENESIDVTLEKTEDEVLVTANDEKTEHILRQTDFEARWTKKNKVSFFGYKDHVAVDKDTKFITDFDITSAEVHDSQRFLEFISKNTTGVWADSAYKSKEITKELLKINPKIDINICNKAYKNTPLTEEQIEENRLISKVRARVEHVFGFMTRSMHCMFINCIGFERARRDITLNNLGYNMKRLVTLKRKPA